MVVDGRIEAKSSETAEMSESCFCKIVPFFKLSLGCLIPVLL